MFVNLSTPSSPKKVEPKAFLFIGPPGGGKTTLAMQFPGVCFLDCDRNLDGPERFVRSKDKNLEYGYIQVTYENGLAVPVEKCFERLCDSIHDLKSEPNVQTVVVDGLTMVNEFIIQKVLADQKNAKLMEPHFWGPFKSYMINLLVAKLRGLKCTTICICHEVIVEKPNSDKKKMMIPELVGYRPAVNGGITDFFGGFFTDMIRCTSSPAPGGVNEFKIQTCKTEYSDLKNSMGMPSEIIVNDGELAYEKLKPYMNGTI